MNTVTPSDAETSMGFSGRVREGTRLNGTNRVSMQEEKPRWRRLRIEPSDLALEIISIVIAIVLATAVGQVVEAHRTDTASREALGQVCREIADDDPQLRQRQALHDRVRRSYIEALARARSEQLDFASFGHAFSATAPHGFEPFNGRTTAWDIARSTNALGAAPFGLRAALQSRYGEVAGLSALNSALLEHIELSSTETKPNFYFAAVAISLILGDIVASEARLAGDDAVALAALRASGVCPG